MKRTLYIACIAVFLFSCKHKKNKELVQYNDEIVNIMEQADRIMKTWNSSDIMVNYDSNKNAAKSRIEVLKDSIKSISPVSSDDTLRLSGISILTGYMQTFNIYDTIYQILSDSIYMQADSLRVQILLQTNKNLMEQQSASFSEIQQRFAARYELDFMQ